MKNNITQKQLIDEGYEQFKFAGEYLFVGEAEIFIDKGDDDIIRFHDGKKYIRFIVSQKDLTFFFKGDLDMLRIGDKTEFDMKIVSERFTFNEEGILDLLQGMRDDNKNCCKRTNDNLKAILGAVKNLSVAPVPEVPVIIALKTDGTYGYEITNTAQLEERYGENYATQVRVNGGEWLSDLPAVVAGNNAIEVRIANNDATISNEIIYMKEVVVTLVDLEIKDKETMSTDVSVSSVDGGKLLLFVKDDVIVEGDGYEFHNLLGIEGVEPYYDNNGYTGTLAFWTRGLVEKYLSLKVQIRKIDENGKPLSNWSNFVTYTWKKPAPVPTTQFSGVVEVNDCQTSGGTVIGNVIVESDESGVVQRVYNHGTPPFHSESGVNPLVNVNSWCRLVAGCSDGADVVFMSVIHSQTLLKLANDGTVIERLDCNS